jgi:hypothetical protein
VVKRHGGATAGRRGARPPYGLADLVQKGHRTVPTYEPVERAAISRNPAREFTPYW